MRGDPRAEELIRTESQNIEQPAVDIGHLSAGSALDDSVE